MIRASMAGIGAMGGSATHSGGICNERFNLPAKASGNSDSYHGLLGLLRGQRAGRRHGRVVVRRGDGGTRVGPVEYRRRQKLAGSEGRGGDLHGTVSGKVGARVERRRDDVTT
jgi:hypothetical protein